MKIKYLLVIGLLSSLLLVVTITGCKKSNTSDTDTSAAEDDAFATFVVNDSKLIADGAVMGMATEKPSKLIYNTCCTWSADSSAKADTIIIHFPAIKCASGDGRIRQGDIIVYWKQGRNYYDSATVVTITYRKYSLTTAGLTMGVTGSCTITNTRKDSLGTIDHSWNCAANLTLNYSAGGSASWTSNYTNTLEKVSGMWFYIINGTASGTSKSGVSYSTSISSPLFWTAYWLNGGPVLTGGKFYSYIEAGQITYNRSGASNTLYLTFTAGGGIPKDTAVATINGYNFPFTLP